jgi:hypothetical protein
MDLMLTPHLLSFICLWLFELAVFMMDAAVVATITAALIVMVHSAAIATDASIQESPSCRIVMRSMSVETIGPASAGLTFLRFVA